MLKIPDLLSELLRDSTEMGRVSAVLSSYELLLKDNSTVFFREYTDHGVEHVQSVLDAAAVLLNPAVQANAVTKADVLLLAEAIVVHDIALHLHEAGFVELISSDIHPVSGRPGCSTNPTEVSPTERSWRDLWSGYLAEVSRWTSSRCVGMLGTASLTSKQVSYLRELANIDNSNLELDDIQRKIIGEFIRRHHGRLAHEIAVHGFPGAKSELGPIDPDSKLADLAGFIGKSHTMGAREVASFLEAKYSRQLRVYGSHPFFLCAVIRIADYLQLDRTRAPSLLFKVRDPVSRISQREWQKHKFVEPYSHNYINPQSVFFQVDERIDYGSFLEISSLLKSVQQELDETNAAVGEVYRSDPVFSALRLPFSRIDSNISTLDFKTKLPYLPDENILGAESEVIPLLAGPLYSNNPCYAIRELLQNSIDACRERSFVRDFVPQSADSPDIELDIYWDNDGWVLSLLDRGVGMAATTVRDYFLRAGASFRNALAWRATFTTDLGLSLIERSGRFGIGVFSAFLLGPTVSVETRNISDAFGLNFVFSEGDRTVELRKNDTLPIGTRVQVRLSKHAVERLGFVMPSSKDSVSMKVNPTWDFWNWFVMSKPTIRYRIVYSDGTVDELIPRHRIPEDPVATGDWRALAVDDLSNLWWSLIPDYPPFTCNGISIGEPWSLGFDEARLAIPFEECFRWSSRNPNFPICAPRIMVTDRDAQLPLDLIRTKVDTFHLSFESQLQDDILLDLIAFALVHGPKSISHIPSRTFHPLLILSGQAPEVAWSDLREEYRSANEIGDEHLDYGYTTKGFFYYEPSLVKKLNISRLLFVAEDKSKYLPKIIDEILKDPDECLSLGLLVQDTPAVPINLSFVSETVLPAPEEFYGKFKGNQIAGLGEILACKMYVDGFASMLTKELPNVRRHGNSLIYEFGNSEAGFLLNKITMTPNKPDETSVLSEVQLSFNSNNPVSNQRLSELWIENLGVRVIPYDPIEREEIIRDIVKKKSRLSEHLAFHQPEWPSG